MSQKITKDGRAQVHLFKDGKSYYMYVHRLVALTFIPNPNNLSQVNHKDENPLNNNVDNLEWCNCKYNCNYGTRGVRVAKGHRLNDPDGIEYQKALNTKYIRKSSNAPKPIVQYDLKNNIINIFKSVAEASRNTNVNSSCINDCLKGRQRSSKGFMFKYYENVCDNEMVIQFKNNNNIRIYED